MGELEISHCCHGKADVAMILRLNCCHHVTQEEVFIKAGQDALDQGPDS